MCKCQYFKYFELISSCVRHLPSNALQRQEMRNQFPSTFNLWWWSSKYWSCWWNRSIRGINAENSSEHARWCPVFVCLGLVEKYQPGEVNFVGTLQNCQHLQDKITKFSLCKICSEQRFVLGRNVEKSPCIAAICFLYLISQNSANQYLSSTCWSKCAPPWQK